MDVRLGDRDDHDDTRRFAVDCEPRAQLGFGNELGSSVDAKCLVESGDHEQQCHVRVDDEVLERVEAVVAGQIGPRQALAVEHGDEPRGTAPR